MNNAAPEFDEALLDLGESRAQVRVKARVAVHTTEFLRQDVVACTLYCGGSHISPIHTPYSLDHAPAKQCCMHHRFAVCLTGAAPAARRTPQQAQQVQDTSSLICMCQGYALLMLKQGVVGMEDFGNAEAMASLSEAQRICLEVLLSWGGRCMHSAAKMEFLECLLGKEEVCGCGYACGQGCAGHPVNWQRTLAGLMFAAAGLLACLCYA